MNQEHLALCSSAEWAEAVQRWIIPWVLEAVDLGDDVLEVGPGPGLTTDVLRSRVARLTAVEVHPDLADALAARQAAESGWRRRRPPRRSCPPAGRFSGAVCLTMLHHVPSPEAQDAVLAEIFRLVRPGGVLAGQDSLDSPELRSLHHDDIYVPVDPAGLQARLEAVGFTAVSVDTNDYAVRFRAAKARAATGSRAATGARNGRT
jgi:SAM-dependent methyltransferase